MPLANENFAVDGVRRTGQNSQREYQEYLRVWWDDVRQRERTPAEVEAIRQGRASGVGNPAGAPAPVTSMSDSGNWMDAKPQFHGTTYRTQEQVDAEKREKARKEKLAAMKLADELEADTRERLGLPPVTQNWNLKGIR